MDLTKSILADTRESVGLSPNSSDFDTELLQHINSAIGKLNQNGVGNIIVVKDTTTTWNNLINPLQTSGNDYFQMVPQFITLSTKIIFDPPPPSAVEYHSNTISELLWRLKVAYEQPTS